MVSEAGSSVGNRYELRDELARGGMGRIWIAEDTRLARRVAIQELLVPSSLQRARFERELALTSRLEHPSIVTVHDGGVLHDGRPFYAMRLVDGESLDRAIARATTANARIALLQHGIAAVDALAYAHSRGIVHRDLKPDNVLVGAFGETVVIDWGLAKDLRAATEELIDGPYHQARVQHTLGGEVLGTPTYMPPEQAHGDAVDERADVYALGAILYHLLSGVRPYEGRSSDEVLAHVIRDAPPSLATVAPELPADLVAIVAKAMARQPDDRYPTAAELAADLKRFQSGQLVAAHRYNGRQLVRRWLRKHRTAVVVAALAVVALAAVGTISVVRIVGAERTAESERQVAEANRALADHRRVAAEQLVTFMLGDLQDQLDPLGKLALMEAPARRALAYFDGQRELDADERTLRVQAEIDLGNAQLYKHDLPAAEAQLRTAAADLAPLSGPHGSTEAHMVDATLHGDLGDVLSWRDDDAGAATEYRSAAEILAAIPAGPDKSRAQRTEVDMLRRLAHALTGEHDLDGARKALTEAQAIAQTRARELPDDVSAQLDLAGVEQG
jgi:hypothetical protein